MWIHLNIVMNILIVFCRCLAQCSDIITDIWFAQCPNIVMYIRLGSGIYLYFVDLWLSCDLPYHLALPCSSFSSFYFVKPFSPLSTTSFPLSPLGCLKNMPNSTNMVDILILRLIQTFIQTQNIKPKNKDNYNAWSVKHVLQPQKQLR